MSDFLITELLLFQAFLIFLNAVFACAEIAVISINDAKLKKMADEGNKKAMRLQVLMQQPAKFLATIQIGITLAGFLGSAFAADNFSDKIVDWLVGQGVGISPKTLDILAVIGITLILSYVTLVLGELVPKRLAMKHAEKIGLSMSYLIYIIAKLFAPLVWMLTASTNTVLRLLGINPDEKDEHVTEEEIRIMIDAGSENGTIDDIEKNMLHNVFEFDDKVVEDVMKHRPDVKFLNADDTPIKWEKMMIQSRHSIYPVYQESRDNIIGTLSFKDYFKYKEYNKNDILKKAMKPVQFVSSSVHIDDLFSNMQRSRNHFAVVVDEYGGIDGIVTMKDLLEEIVGELEDDASMPCRPNIKQINADTWLIKGSTPIDEVSANLNVQFPDEEFDTLAGFVLFLMDNISKDKKNIKLKYQNMNLKVVRTHGLKIEDVLVQLKNDPLKNKK